MALVTQTPANPSISPNATPLTSGLANDFRPTLNAYVAAVEDKAQLVEAYLEQLTAVLGNGAVSGGTISAGAGLSVSVAILTAIVGNIVAFDASQTVGGLTASATNYLFLRQDGTWTVNTTGAVPTDISAHGAYLLWGTATTDVASVTAVSNARDSFRFGSPLVQERGTINAGESVTVGAGMQSQLFGTLSIKGALSIAGNVRIIA